MTEGAAQTAAIIIAAYQCEATIARAVKSALAQAGVSEVCVVDDASGDGTARAALACDDGTGRLQVLTQSANGGPAAARNRAIAATRAEWIGVLDADDYLLPGRVAALLALGEEADFVADILLRTAEGADAPQAAAWGESAGARRIAFAEFLEGNLAKGSRLLDLGFIKPLARRAFLERHGLSYRTDMRLGEDYELYARALALGARFLLSATAGYVSIERPGSLSTAHSAEDLRLLRDCDDDLARIRAFSPQERRALRRHRTSVDCRYQWRMLIEAVKTRDAGAAARTFHTPRAAIYLCARLLEQAWLRGRAALR